MHLDSLVEMGIMGLSIPEAYGGLGLRPTVLFDAVAAIAGACGSTASMVTAHWLATDSILYGGDEAQRARFLPKLMSMLKDRGYDDLALRKLAHENWVRVLRKTWGE